MLRSLLSFSLDLCPGKIYVSYSTIKNIFVPILKEIEDACDEQDLFHYYLRMFKRNVHLRNSKPEMIPEIFELHIGSYMSINEDAPFSDLITNLILFCYRHNFFSEVDMEKSTKAEMELQKILKASITGVESHSMPITISFLEENSEAMEGFKKTWLGQIILFLIGLREKVERTSSAYPLLMQKVLFAKNKNQ